MRHRIFIAINLPKEIKRNLIEYQTRWPELPVRWIKPENLHITLVFLGNISDEELLEVLNTTKEVVQRNKAFSINLKKICYGPPKKMPPRSMSPRDSFLRSSSFSIKNWTPRMIWVEGAKSKELANLKDDLEKSLLERISFPRENRALTPHITLGRIRSWEWRQIEPEERSDVNEEINLIFEVNSIEIMESELKMGGAEYTILESTQLGQ